MTQSCTMLKRNRRVFCGMCPLLIPGPSPNSWGRTSLSQHGVLSVEHDKRSQRSDVLRHNSMIQLKDSEGFPKIRVQ